MPSSNNEPYSGIILDIVAKKQALRDAPADSGIAAASDPDALKAQWNTSILGDSPYS